MDRPGPIASRTSNSAVQWEAWPPKSCVTSPSVFPSLGLLLTYHDSDSFYLRLKTVSASGTVGLSSFPSSPQF